MSMTVGTGPVADVLARLENDLDELSTTGVGSCTDDGLLDTWRRLETIRRRLEPVDHAIVTEVETRSLPARHACKSTGVLARQLLRIGPGEAHARVAAARNLGPQVATTGQPLEPTYPTVAAAQAEGAISARHARIITDAIEKLPDEVAAKCDRAMETQLVGLAREQDPELLARYARRLGYLLDQDGQYKDDAYRQRHRELHLRRRADGSARLDGELTPECAEHLATQLGSLAKPSPASDGTQDPRTAAQRRHDGLLEMLKLVERANLVPTAGGCPATIVVTMDADAYATGAGSATTGHGYTVPADLAKTWAGPEARIIAVLHTLRHGSEVEVTPHAMSARAKSRRPRERQRACGRAEGALRIDGSTRACEWWRRRYAPRRLGQRRRRRPALRVPPPQLRSPRLVGEHDRRPTLVDPTTVAGPAASPAPKHDARSSDLTGSR